MLSARIAACLEKQQLRDAALAGMARMELELKTARELQLSMVPTVFPAPNAQWPIELAAVLEPALELGGDFYDFFRLRSGAQCFAVGDVCDKGVAAALFMARAMSTVRLVASVAEGPAAPADWVAAANEELCGNNATNMFATLLLGVLDPLSGELTLVNAGNVEPWLIDPANGARRLMTNKRVPLGVRVDARYEAFTTHLDAGATLFICTDGVTEATDPGGDLFGDARTESILTRLAACCAREVIDGVMTELRAFVASAPQADDIAALAVRRVGTLACDTVQSSRCR